MKMPSVVKRKNISSLESEPSPKKGKFNEASPSPVSSPIKGPLQDHSETNSPIFVPKCFYGLKKSIQCKDIKTPTKKKSVKVSSTGNAKKIVETSSLDTIAGRVEQLMSEIIADSPVKQRLYESCSKAEFKKLFSNEYKQLEDKVRMECVRTTRRTSKIVHTMEEEESDTDDYESGDNGEAIVVTNGVLDVESDEENAEINLPLVKIPAQNGNISLVEKNLSIRNSPNHNKLNTDLNIEKSDNKASTPKDSDKKLSNEPAESTPSSGKKFFKTRTPVDNSKMYGIVRGKGFDLKVVPKTLQDLFDKKSKKGQQKKNHPPHSHKKMSESSKSPASDKPVHAATDSDRTLTDSAIVLSPQAGFWFAPGFLSPEKNFDEQYPDQEIPNEVEGYTDERLSLNKSNTVTYLRTPPPKKIIGGDTNSGPKSPADLTMPSNSVYCLPREEIPAIAVGSEDLFSSQSPSQSGNLRGENAHQNQILNDKKGDSTTKNKESVSQNETRDSDGSEQKLFPVFTRRSARLASTPKQSKRSPLAKSTVASTKDPNQEQMFLDAGQKKFGATQCPVCSMVYCHADPEDETAHTKFHKRLLEALKYPGWKNPRVLQEYPEDLGQVIMVLVDDPKHMRKKVDEVNQVMARELGFPETPSSFLNRLQKVFLYVYEKEIAGCCVAEPIKEGFRILPEDMDTTETSGQRPWRSSDVPEPAFVGISRLWVAASRRKTGVATKLVDCVRQWFDYGTLTPLHRLAFSDPTPDGRMFAQKYMRSKTFLVYKYNTHL